MKINVLAVMSSLYRPNNLTRLSLESAARCSIIDRINVHGYTPWWEGRPAKIVGHPIPASPVHAAYRWLDTNVPTEVLTGNEKRKVVDSVKRAQWRSQLCIDAWYVLRPRLASFAPEGGEGEGEADVIIWIENDAMLDCAKLRRAVDAFWQSGSAGASCYGGYTAYQGVGTVCMMFAGDHIDSIRRHILGYHMVQPLDWILSDYAQGKWRVYNASYHGLYGRKHSSTLDT